MIGESIYKEEAKRYKAEDMRLKELTRAVIELKDRDIVLDRYDSPDYWVVPSDWVMLSPGIYRLEDKTIYVTPESPPANGDDDTLLLPDLGVEDED